MKIGIDIVDIKRIKKLIKRKKFIEKIFSKKEIAYCERFKNKEERYAAKFAAKEAVIKTLKSHINYPLKLKNIEILNDENGEPYVFINGFNIKGDLSISHISSVAVAVFILEHYERNKD